MAKAKKPAKKVTRASKEGNAPPRKEPKLFFKGFAKKTDKERREIERKFTAHKEKEKLKHQGQFVDYNQWYLLRSKHGKDALFSNPDFLWEAACEYFVHTNNRPWLKTDFKSTKDGLKKIKIPTTTPYTHEALCLYLHCSTAYFRAFKSTLKENHPRRNDFITVLAAIEQIIYNKKFEGAVVGTYNTTLIAYDLGFKKDNSVTLNPGGITIQVTKPEHEKLLDEVKAQLEKIDTDADKLKTLEDGNAK